ncbi:heavy metal-binding protein HIP-like isoform X6 [Trematomus bernacchii]|uniref:heavy metal-binding protein HIP-like isoform X6 n=1 Tax=Trematomus bernacchii TaxID=40690 RepID=UPI00146E3375|nr:heavy metal-binding protein HIP-like isoform X6 [Trematomus bernacchii]
MRRAAVFLALLLCLLWTGAQGEDGGGTGKKEGEFDIQVVKAAHDQSSSETQMSTDVWAELKELRDMAIKHRIKIQRLEQDNTVTQVRLTASESKNAALEGRMSSSEKQVEELQRENADLLDRVTASENKSTVLESRMSSSEKEVQELQRVNAALEARMSSSEKEVEEVKRVNADLLARVTASENKSTALESRMSSSEKEVEELQRENTDRPQVAFSAGLTDSGSVGPFTTDTTLKYSKVFTNIGQAYSPTTGIFTAPVGGVYYFRFNMWGDIDSSYTHVGFFHNDQRKMMLSDYNDGYGFVSASNSMVLQLEKGDVVYIVLNSNNAIFDDSYNRIIFSGFLLFPL